MKVDFKMAWIMGWALPHDYFESQVVHAFPDAKHCFFEPTPKVISNLTFAGSFDLTVGYSLGSLILLKSAIPNSVSGKKVMLAPILGFTQEMLLGGKIPRAQLRYTARQFKLDPSLTVNKFYKLSGLGSVPQRTEPYCSEALHNLAYGLEYLEKNSFMEQVDEDILTLCGELDSLLDWEVLKTRIPEMHIIKQATHDPVKLIEALKTLIT